MALEDMVVRIQEWVDSHYFGKYRGLVTDIDDPEGLGRITAQIPAVLGEEESPWAMPSVPFAGAGHGWVTLPEVGDGVWVEFEAGDPSRPIWTGCWWADNEMPSPGGTLIRLFATSNGHQLILDEDADEVTLKHSGGPSIVLTANDITLKVGSKKIVLSSSGLNVNQGALEVR